MELKAMLMAVKTAIEKLEMKATKENCSNLNVCHHLLDKVIAACDNVKKEVSESDGNGEGQDVPG